MKEIDAAKFKDILKHGMEHLFQDQELLNRINVFPVPDGDTGDNLVHTLKPAYEEIDALREPRLDDLADRLAKPHALAIAYTDNPQVVAVLEDELARSSLRITSIYAVATAAVLGAHAGPGTFCLWALPDD
jgi:fatty acid-binding protein DegV